jgi:ankyrin repeat protein
MTRDRREITVQFAAADEAYRSGDLARLREALGNPPDFPNCCQPLDLGVGDRPLEYAIYWSPIAFIEELLELGADPNYPDPAGFPPLIAALSSGRPDLHHILRLLIDRGADVAQRGLNDWTALHYAVDQRDLDSVAILLENDADPNARTRIDDCTSPLEDAERMGFAEAVQLFRSWRPQTSADRP